MTAADDTKRELVDRLLEACHDAGYQAANADRHRRGESLLVLGDHDVYVEPEFPNGQVNFLADVVCEVLNNFGWVEPEWQGRWALFGEDFLVREYSPDAREPHPVPSGAYRMNTRGGVPSFWRVLCQAAVRRGWIHQAAAPAEG